MFFSLVERALRNIHHGRIHLDFGSIQRTYGSPLEELEASISVHDATFFRDVALRGELGLGESYVAEKWTSRNLPNLALVLQLNVDVFRSVLTGGTFIPFPKTLFERLTQRGLRRRRKTSLANSRMGMAVSYDVGNDFFEIMLGPTRLYSCAIYPTDDATLEEAQQHKLDLLIDKADIADGHRVLDIGCGWGTLLGAIRSRYDCDVHGISLSQRQLEHCRATVLGQFDYRDYRELDASASYDRIVSVGMIEHVGADQLERYMSAVARFLKPGGRAVLHTMVGGDMLDVAAGKQLSSFSTKTIMPIGYVPNPEELTRAAMKTKRLSIVHAERFGVHYGKTMRQWRENILANRETIERSYSAEHVRVYDYVFGMAAACFTSGTFDLLQLVVQNEPVTNRAAVYDPRYRSAAPAHVLHVEQKRRATAG